MPFLARVASLATMTFAAALVASSGTPGFARDLNEVVNASTLVPVPATVQPVPLADPALPTSLPVAPATQVVATTQPGDTIAFGTLAAAVAAQPTHLAMGADANDDDLACMAGAIYFEAKGEPLVGQLAVAEVILNRTRSGRFPKSICSVVTQRGQFSFVRGGRIPPVAVNRQYRTALAVARVALGEMWDSPATDAMFFHARRVSPGWGRKSVATIGNHVFYR